MGIRQLELASLRIDGGTQMRAKIDQDTVTEYRDLWQAETDFPPLVVYWDGTDFWLAGGFHRYHGAKAAGLEKVKCEVHEGTQRDAIFFAVKDNKDHGLKRSGQDKRKAIKTLLEDKEWSKRSNRWIAETVGVGDDLVSDVRKQLSETTVEKPQPTRTGKDGKERPAETTEKPPKPDKKKPKEPEVDPVLQEVSDGVTDLVGNQLPEHLVSVSQDTWTEDTVQTLDKIVRDIASRCNKQGQTWLLRKVITDHLNAARKLVNDSAFHAICPECNGAKKGCDQCRHKGWVPEWRYTEMTSGVR